MVLDLPQLGEDRAHRQLRVGLAEYEQTGGAGAVARIQRELTDAAGASTLPGVEGNVTVINNDLAFVAFDAAGVRWVSEVVAMKLLRFRSSSSGCSGSMPLGGRTSESPPSSNLVLNGLPRVAATHASGLSAM